MVVFLRRNIGNIGSTVGVTALIALMAMSLFWVKSHPVKDRMETSAPLYALHLRSITEGSVFLLSSSVGEEDYYTYLTGRDDGGLVLRKTDTYWSVVFEVETDFRLEVWHIGANGATEFRFYIPKGSVRSDYNVDLQDLEIKKGE